ncbi:MAG: PTS IIA-like nitrogen regulatory protein PtsN [Pseudomonadota bacterium]
MDLGELISQDAIIAGLRAKSKKQVLQELATKAGALTPVPARDVFDCLLQRERLGSTGMGQGIAIPHGKLPQLSSILCIFARLSQPIDFDALDDEPVDLIFLLLAPEHAGADHLKALARISRLLREPDMSERLRSARDRGELFRLLTAHEAHAA